ncbi:helix-turn-helix domain-containing protein [Schleiferilactobacillus harbinensis]|jgi:transposase|uniref:Helix-turn-helix domain-containing protein n=10 Tax=Schleiferilactobacillus harbinensis TaxID=304207 RepID=A0A5P8M7D6_9LACO|nr:helix-turn-helix domain-containing protein [Schleiferilactobacillus harbinensis]MBO3093150.1 helix-turn-helix domain-containing protein [Schleiferilactobacillus harbinensis]MCT2909460.1 transposase [Schleiferilactobacillus harbinensis]QFR22112.1 helix-turn-helix domain-containing protein [Schleiferilactobacillus harbinensis]QFR23453.1 helix-turn-helix domain-containing protein [Schleiferilactobacillus harbinensis]QFR23988.1 helix-turn-helix domain-containing protein [Schleiferilactobacillus
MRRKGIRYSLEDKIEFVNRVLSGQSLMDVQRSGGPRKEALSQWVQKYKQWGAAGLVPKERAPRRQQRKRTTYSSELKFQIVQEYLAGGTSYYKLCAKYDISNPAVVYQWVSLYNSGQLLQTTRGSAPMTKGRKTTYVERIEIAQWTIAHDMDYQGAIKHFGVSYGQVYSWVKKFRESGEEGLTDRRGQRKPESTLDENERLKLENKESKARIDYLETKIALLKKLQDVERRSAGNDTDSTNILPFTNSPKK